MSMILLCSSIRAADNIADAPQPATQHLPSYLLEVPASVADVLIADAGTATLIRYSRTENGVVEKDRRYMSIGLEGVGKQRAWDRKTPLGVYFITEELDTSKLAPKYGIAAFPLDYPNAWDRYNERTGSGIWLHGVDASAPDRPPRDTDGVYDQRVDRDDCAICIHYDRAGIIVWYAIRTLPVVERII